MEPRYPAPNEANRIIINMHRSPDLDCVVGLFCFLLACMISPFDKRILYNFLPAGERYKGEILPGDLVVHIDTGRIFNPATYDFDHHQLDHRSTVSYLPSAARGIFNHFRIELACYPWLELLIQMTDEKDSPKRNRAPMPERVLEAKNRMNEELRELNAEFNTDMRVVCARDNLEIISLLFIDAPSDMVDDRNRILTGLVNLLSWHSRKQSRVSGDMNAFIDRGRRVINRHRLQFILLDEPVVSRKKLRNTLRSQGHYRNNVDVYVFPDMSEGREGDVGITCVLEERIEGMEALAEELRVLSKNRAEQDNGVFLHHEKFCIYIKASAEISQDEAEHLALRCLRPRGAEALAATA